MTRAERHALCFLAGLAVLGAGVRAWRSAATARPVPAASERALASQLAAVDSAVLAEREARARQEERRAEKARVKEARERARELAATARVSVAPSAAPSAPMGPIDVDRASATELEALPRIGPTLAQRIVADRDALGAFGSLDGLQRVKGGGPALAARLAPLVTFSGTPRPVRAVQSPARGPPSSGVRARRRPAAP
ncbi:MAG TPA: helix-hairpin-helix domain-containing protein [Gemmatimonadaceae bacterium]|nr:helix-hairpin-helix domain-containing protein [Gemmatimonadaceae bacterium]